LARQNRLLLARQNRLNGILFTTGTENKADEIHAIALPDVQ